MRRGKKGLNGFIFATFVGRFPSDGATSMAVKGLTGSGSVHCRDHFWPFLQWSWESAMQI